MAFTAKTRQQLVHDVISLLKDWGTQDFLNGAISSSATSLICTVKYGSFTANSVFEIDQELILGPSSIATSTTVAIQKRGWQGTTGAAHNDGSIIRINPKYKQYEIIDLINTCLTTELQKRGVSDATTTSANNTYLYDLPTGVTGTNLKEVYIRSSNTDSSARTEDQIRRYRINEGQGTSGVDQIEFPFTIDSGRYIMFVYASGFSYLDDDTDSCDLPVNAAAHRLPVLYAAAKLLPQRQNPNLRKNTNPDNTTPQTDRFRGGKGYWDEFVRIRSLQGLAPNRNVPITVGW